MLTLIYIIHKIQGKLIEEKYLIEKVIDKFHFHGITILSLNINPPFAKLLFLTLEFRSNLIAQCALRDEPRLARMQVQ